MLCVALVVMDGVSPARLAAFIGRIKRLSPRYASQCSPAIYQADVRCRLERMRWLRRSGVELWPIYKPTAARRSFKPDKP